MHGAGAVDLTRRQVEIDGIVADDAAHHRADRLHVHDGIGQDATHGLFHGQAVALRPHLQPPNDLAVQAPTLKLAMASLRWFP